MNIQIDLLRNVVRTPIEHTIMNLVIAEMHKT